MSFDMMNHIFKSFVHSSIFPGIDNYELKRYAYQLKESHSGVVVSNVLGWQSADLKKNYLNNTNPEIAKLIDCIESNLISFKNELNIKSELSLYTTNIWININPKNAYNHLHNHPHSILSGVYYVACRENSGEIVFKNPASNIPYHLPPWLIDDFNDITSPIYRLNPVPGMMLIFPSWIEHLVLPNLDEEDRISIAFNVTASK